MLRSFNTELKTPWHVHVIALLKALGYPHDEQGVCFGIAATTTTAVLAGKLALLEESINILSHADPKTIQSQNHGLTPTEFRDALAFLDSIALHQDASESKHIFPSTVQFEDQNAGVLEVGKILNLSNSTNNDIEQAFITCKAVYQDGLIDSISELTERCRSLSDSETPLGFLISNLGHTISCNYDPNKSAWICIDANKQSQGTSPLIITDSLPRLINFIWTSLARTYRNRSMCVIDVQVLCRKNDLALVESELGQWIKEERGYLSPETLESLSLDFLLELIFVAIRVGDDKAIEAIFNTDFNHEIFYTKGGVIRYAIRNNKNHLLYRLLDEGVDPNRVIPGAHSLWQIAMDYDNIDAISILLKDVVVDKDFRQLTLEPLLLNYICEHGRLDIAQMLLKCRGISINEQERNGDTALHCAVRSGNIDLVKFLVSHPAIDPNIGDYYYNTAYHVAMLLSDSAEQAQDVRKFRAIAQVIANHPKFDLSKHQSGDRDLLFYFVKQGDTEAIDRILWKRSHEKPQIDSEGESILHHGMKHSQTLLIKLVKHFKDEKELFVYELTTNLRDIQTNGWRDYGFPLQISMCLLAHMPELLEAYQTRGEDALVNEPYASLSPYSATLQTLIDIYRSAPAVPDIPRSHLSLLEVAIIRKCEDLLGILLMNNDILLQLGKTNHTLDSTPLTLAMTDNNYTFAIKLITAGSHLEELYRKGVPQISEGDKEMLKKMTVAIRDKDKLVGDTTDNQTFCYQAMMMDKRYNSHLKDLLKYEIDKRTNILNSRMNADSSSKHKQ